MRRQPHFPIERSKIEAAIGKCKQRRPASLVRYILDLYVATPLSTGQFYWVSCVTVEGFSCLVDFYWR